MTSIYSVPSAAAFYPARFGANVAKATAPQTAPVHAHEPAFSGGRMTRRTAMAFAALVLTGIGATTACGPTDSGSPNSPSGGSSSSSTTNGGKTSEKSLQELCQGGAIVQGTAQGTQVNLEDAKKHLVAAIGAKNAEALVAQSPTLGQHAFALEALSKVPQPILNAALQIQSKSGKPLTTFVVTDKVVTAAEPVKGRVDVSTDQLPIGIHPEAAKMNPSAVATLITGEFIDGLNRRENSSLPAGIGQQIAVLDAINQSNKTGSVANYTGNTQAEQALRKDMLAMLCDSGKTPNPKRQSPAEGFLDTKAPGYDALRSALQGIVGFDWTKPSDDPLGLGHFIAPGKNVDKQTIARALAQ